MQGYGIKYYDAAIKTVALNGIYIYTYMCYILQFYMFIAILYSVVWTPLVTVN